MARYSIVSDATGAVLGRLDMIDSIAPLMPVGTHAKMIDSEPCSGPAWVWDPAAASDPAFPVKVNPDQPAVVAPVAIVAPVAPEPVPEPEQHHDHDASVS